MAPASSLLQNIWVPSSPPHAGNLSGKNDDLAVHGQGHLKVWPSVYISHGLKWFVPATPARTTELLDTLPCQDVRQLNRCPNHQFLLQHERMTLRQNFYHLYFFQLMTSQHWNFILSAVLRLVERSVDGQNFVLLSYACTLLIWKELKWFRLQLQFQ